MTEFQVVAVYPSGRRFPVRAPHDSYLGAEMHRDAAIRQCEPGETYRYEIDMYYTGSDGQIHWDGNVDPVARLGYAPTEVTGARA